MQKAFLKINFLKNILILLLALIIFNFLSLTSVFALEPNDPRMIGPDPANWEQWGLQKIDAAGAWDVTQGSPDIKIAIIDSGVNDNHKDLKGKVVDSVNFSCDKGTDDYHGRTANFIGHGTLVAGIAAAVTNNNEGIAGIGFNTSILNVKVMGEKCEGVNALDLKRAIDWSVQAGAKVINLSIDGGLIAYNPFVDSAIQNAWNSGVVIVVSAGNNSSSQYSFPAAYNNVISVAATNKNDDKVDTSNYGNWVSVAAPGLNIIGPCAGNNAAYCSANNTSVAAPFVSGLAALIWAQHAGEPDFDQHDVKNLIESTADKIPGTGTYWANGRINACKALGNSRCPLPTIIRIFAAGTSAYLEYPRMELLIDDVVVKTFDKVDGDPALKPYSKYFYSAYLPQPITDASRIKIRFINDDKDPVTGANRDLYIDKISINGVNYEAEASDTYSTGHWNGSNCESGYFNSENLACNGYIQFKKPAPIANIAGTYLLHVTCGASCSGGPWDHVMTIQSLDPNTGFYTGSAYYVSDPSFTFTVSGTITGSQMTMNIVGTTGYPSGFKSDGTGTIGVDGTMTGSSLDTLGRYTNWTATKTEPKLVAYWKMDETSWSGAAGEVKDQVSNTNDGTALNGVNTGTGKFLNGGYFDGLDDFVRTPNSSLINSVVNDYTLAAWIKRGVLSDFGSIISKTDGSTWLWDFDMGICQANMGSCGGSNDTLYLHSSGMSPYTMVSTGTISDTTNWHHVAITRSGTTVTLYIDGEPSGTGTQTGTLRNDSFGIQIGADGTWSSISNFKGQIDEARIYNYALTPSQIKDLKSITP